MIPKIKEINSNQVKCLFLYNMLIRSIKSLYIKSHVSRSQEEVKIRATTLPDGLKPFFDNRELLRCLRLVGQDRLTEMMKRVETHASWGGLGCHPSWTIGSVPVFQPSYTQNFAASHFSLPKYGICQIWIGIFTLPVIFLKIQSLCIDYC